jgi:hypothetical protein
MNTAPTELPDLYPLLGRSANTGCVVQTSTQALPPESLTSNRTIIEKYPQKGRTLSPVDPESAAKYLIQSFLPSFVYLDMLAKSHQPPQEFFDEDVERPW